MKLYYTKGACSLVVRIIINELDINSEFESVDLQSKQTETGKNFLNINPNGAVPTLEIHSHEILTENAAILQYLADHTKANKLLPPINDFNRYRVLEWLNYVATELHKGIGILFNPAITQEQKEKLFIPLIRTKLNYVNNHLEKHHYLIGDQFTLPDAYLFVMLLWTTHFQLDLKEYKHLAKYFTELNQRKSIQYSLKQEA